MLVGSVVLAFAAFMVVLATSLTTPFRGEPPMMAFGVLLIMTAMLALSRVGHFKVAAWLLTLLYLSLALYSLLLWSIDLPTGVLVLALALVVSSVLLGTRPTFVLTLVTAAILIVLGWMQQQHLLSYDGSWLMQGISFSDAIGYTLVLGLMATVSWLSNREIERSFRRAMRSEELLMIERDQLELRVAERTQQLETEQLQRLMQLSRFAEFGKLAGGIIHEIVSPLTAVSLNLEQMRGRLSGETLERAVESTKRLERYVEAARKQLLMQSENSTFPISHEIEGVIEFLSGRARQGRIKVQWQCDPDVEIFGNPIRFSQVVSNLLANAIDAYPKNAPRELRQVDIGVSHTPKDIEMRIHDWGRGIGEREISHVFEPFYTSKSSESGMGLGLYLCKEIIENEYHGSIRAESDKESGTTFTVTLPRSEKERATTTS